MSYTSWLITFYRFFFNRFHRPAKLIAFDCGVAKWTRKKIFVQMIPKCKSSSEDGVGIFKLMFLYEFSYQAFPSMKFSFFFLRFKNPSNTRRSLNCALLEWLFFPLKKKKPTHCTTLLCVFPYQSDLLREKIKKWRIKLFWRIYLFTDFASLYCSCFFDLSRNKFS